MYVSWGYQQHKVKFVIIMSTMHSSTVGTTRILRISLAYHKLYNYIDMSTKHSSTVGSKCVLGISPHITYIS